MTTPTLFDAEPDPEPSEGRVEALAGVLAGFAAPGYSTWTHCPKRVQEPCRNAARDALRTLAAAIPPEHRAPAAPTDPTTPLRA